MVSLDGKMIGLKVINSRHQASPVKFAVLVFCEEFNGARQALGIRKKINGSSRINESTA
jgi:hypothetical protein